MPGPEARSPLPMAQGLTALTAQGSLALTAWKLPVRSLALKVQGSVVQLPVLKMPGPVVRSPAPTAQGTLIPLSALKMQEQMVRHVVLTLWKPLLRPPVLSVQLQKVRQQSPSMQRRPVP